MLKRRLRRRCVIAILQLIDQLHDLLTQGIDVPFSSYRLVRARDIEHLLERMRINVPSSIRESERTISERDRIIAEAQAEAERIVQDARRRATEMLSERSLVTAAQTEADRIVDEGKEIARRRAEEADQYAAQVLQGLSSQLLHLNQQVENGLDLLGGRQRSAAKRSAEQPEGRARGQSPNPPNPPSSE